MTKKGLRDDFVEMLWWLLAGWLVIYVYRAGAGDWERFYLPALSDYASYPAVGNPSYVLFLFRPLSLLPVKIGGALLAAINVACVYLCHRMTGANKWLILFSLPTLIIITFGQLDGLVMLGAVLGSAAACSGNGPRLGVAFLLLGLKPQVGGVLMVVCLARTLMSHGWRPACRALGVAGAVLLASFGAFGFWPPAWLTKMGGAAATDYAAFICSNIGLFPWGLVALAAVLWFAREDVPALLTATMLSMPYAGYHSLASALAFRLPPFIYLITWLPALFPARWSALVTPLLIVAWGLLGGLRATRKGPLPVTVGIFGFNIDL